MRRGDSLRAVLEQLHILRRELKEEDATMKQTAEQFDANLARMQEQTKRKRGRVRYLELQVRRIQDRRRRPR